MKTTTFTSTISPQLNDWLAAYAKQTDRTRRAVLEDALLRYKADAIRASLRADFAKVANDPDLLEMAEWGMNDYAAIVKTND